MLESEEIDEISPDKESFREYLFFWGGQLISLLGSSVVQFSIVYWITVVTRSPIYLGIGAFLGFGTTIAVTPFAGVFVDRWDRKKIIGILDFLQVFVTLILVYLFYYEIVHIYHIFAVLALRGIFQGFHQTSIQAIIPIMIPRKRLNQFNSINYLGTGVIYLVGPLVGALLIGIFGVTNLEFILLADGVTFLFALVPLILIKIPDVRTKEQKEKPASFKDEFNEGVSFIKEKKGLLSLLAVFTGANFFFTPLFVLLPLIVVDPDLIGGNQNTLAIALAVQQAGTIIGSMVLTTKRIFKNNARGVFVGILIGTFGIITVGTAAMYGNVVLLMMGTFIVGVTLPVANVHSSTIWQSVVPAELQGRVFSVRRTTAQASGPIAMALAGYVSALIGSVVVLIVGGILEIFLLFYSWYFTGFSTVEQSIKLGKVDEPISISTKNEPSPGVQTD